MKHRLRTLVFTMQMSEQVTATVPLFSNPKNNSPQSVRSLHFTLPRKLMLEAGNLKWKCFSLLTPELSSILNLILFVIFLFVWNFWEYTFIKWILQSNLHLRLLRLYMIISNISRLVHASVLRYWVCRKLREHKRECKSCLRCSREQL